MPGTMPPSLAREPGRETARSRRRLRQSRPLRSRTMQPALNPLGAPRLNHRFDSSFCFDLANQKERQSQLGLEATGVSFVSRDDETCLDGTNIVWIKRGPMQVVLPGCYDDGRDASFAS